MMKNFDLENRLVAFAVMALAVAEKLPPSYAGNHLGGQLTRSGTAPALNYGEAQAAESKRDFLHKMRVCLKELRESQICLKIIAAKPLLAEAELKPALQECGELVAIFTTIIKRTKDKM
jgi:four helix bundle protein